MSTPPHRRRTARLLALLTSCAVLAAATACSSGGRDYSIPARFCHVPMGSDVMAPMLPDGEKLEEERRGNVEHEYRDTDFAQSNKPVYCELRVDGEDTVYVQLSRGEKILDPTKDPVESKRVKNLEVVKGLPFDLTVLGDRTIIIDTRCNGPKSTRVRPVLEFSSGAENTVQRRKDILAFGKAYTLALKKELGCTV
ncbi:hypothetical protein [Streptomyces sp. NPDC054863]